MASSYACASLDRDPSESVFVASLLFNQDKPRRESRRKELDVSREEELSYWTCRGRNTSS